MSHANNYPHQQCTDGAPHEGHIHVNGGPRGGCGLPEWCPGVTGEAATPGRCGWHDLERVWNADEQRWICPHYSQAVELAQLIERAAVREHADIRAAIAERMNRRG